MPWDANQVKTTEPFAGTERMVGKCANPECSAEFKYLHEGVLFRIDMREHAGPNGTCQMCGRPLHVRHFWLCTACSRAMTVKVAPDGSVRVIPKSALTRDAVPLACPPGRLA